MTLPTTISEARSQIEDRFDETANWMACELGGANVTEVSRNLRRGVDAVFRIVSAACPDVDLSAPYAQALGCKTWLKVLLDEPPAWIARRSVQKARRGAQAGW